MDVQQLLKDFKAGKVSESQVLSALKQLPFKDIDFAKIDTHRMLRKQFGEVVFCQNKTTGQILSIVKQMDKGNTTILLTRVFPEAAQAILKRFKAAEYNKAARTIVLRKQKVQLKGKILIVTAGTSDIPVAEEARVTAELMGSHVEMLHDVGVAGLHRLLKNVHRLEEPNAIIVAAGMEGALPSVLCGLTSKPIIALPTSVGYGASFQGLSALLTMLNSCCPGIAVVNIDNGFGAGYFAGMLNRMSR